MDWFALVVSLFSLAMGVASWLGISVRREEIEHLSERVEDLEREPPDSDTAITQPIRVMLPVMHSAADAIDIAVDEGLLDDPKGAA